MPKYLTDRTIKGGKKKVWVVTFPTAEIKPNGKPRYHSKTFEKLAEAKDYLSDLQRQRKTGKAVVAAPITVDEFLDRYLKSADLRENTRDSYVEILDSYIRPKLGKLKMKSLTTLKIQAVYDEMLERDLAPRTVRYAHSIFHSALDQGMDWNLLPFNPAKGVKLPKKKRAEVRYLSGDEIGAFMGAAWFDLHSAYFELALVTGARPGELMGLKWSEVDLENETIKIKQTLVRDREGWYLRPPKTAKAKRTIPIPPATVQTLIEHKADQGRYRLKVGRSWSDHGLVFTNDVGQPLERHNFVRRHFKPTLRRAVRNLYAADRVRGNSELIEKRDEMKKLSLYGLRHTCATLMLEKGINPKTVSEQLGHKSVAFTLDTYAHVTEAMQGEAVSVLGKALYE
jgi:integrase